MEPKKYEYIDSLRGVAILLVLVIHNGQHGMTLGEVAPLLDKFRFAGRYGVQLFFLVSAYTLMLSHHSRKGERMSTRNFFIRRFFRITPMYYIALVYYSFDSLFFASNYAVLENVKEINIQDAIRNLLFLNNFYPNMPHYVPGGWSTVAEVSFYLVLPVIYKYITDFSKALALFIVSVAVSLIFCILFMDLYPSSSILYMSFFNQLPVFVLGLILYFGINQRKISVNKWLIGALIAGTPIYIYFIPDENILDCLKASLILFVFALIICKKQYKVISNPFFSFVGKISYSMYLIHFGVLYWMSRLDFVDFFSDTTRVMYIANYLVRYMVLFAISAGLSYLSYRYIEEFFIRKGKKLFSD